jgi:hypothetical protein
MQLDLLILDNFYNDPVGVREFALSQAFDVPGNYPGNRTKPFYTDDVKDLIQKMIFAQAGKITAFEEFKETTAFQYTTAADRSWVHADQTTMWAGVCYLTPDAPPSGGTGIFKHKPTGYTRVPRLADGSYNMEILNEINKDSQDMTKWELMDRVANKFNRLVLYRGDLFHVSLDYFGRDMYSGRLFQTFFFNTEY